MIIKQILFAKQVWSVCVDAHASYLSALGHDMRAKLGIPKYQDIQGANHETSTKVPVASGCRQFAYLSQLQAVKALEKSIAAGGGRFNTTNLENNSNLESNHVKRKAGILGLKDYYAILHNIDCETTDDLECNLATLLQRDNYQLDCKEGAPCAIISFQRDKTLVASCLLATSACK